MSLRLVLAAALAFCAGIATTACHRQLCGEPPPPIPFPIEDGKYTVYGLGEQDGTLVIADDATRIRIEWPSKDLDAPYLEAELLQDPE